MEKFPSTSPENNESDIQGEGFVIKKDQPVETPAITFGKGENKRVIVPGRKESKPNEPLHPVEFRPGESTDAAKERQARESKEADRGGKVESSSNAEFAAEHFAEMLQHQSEYSETLIVNPDGHIEKKRRANDSTSPYFGGFVETSADLYKLMKEVQDAHPEYQISFENDQSGTWIKYKVSK